MGAWLPVAHGAGLALSIPRGPWPLDCAALGSSRGGRERTGLPRWMPRSKDSHGDSMAVAVPVSHAIPPAGTGPIHMNEVQCLGTEKTLWSCPFKNITQEDCKHTEDAAVRCNIPYMGYETLVRTVGGCQHPRDHGAWQIPASGPPEQGAGGGPMGPTVGWSIISPPLNPIMPHTFPPGLWQGCPGGLGDFAGGSPKLPL